MDWLKSLNNTGVGAGQFLGVQQNCPSFPKKTRMA